MNCTCGWESEKGGRQAGRQAGRNGKERKRKEEGKKERRNHNQRHLLEWKSGRVLTDKTADKKQLFYWQRSGKCMHDRQMSDLVNTPSAALSAVPNFIHLHVLPFFPSSQRFEPRRIWHSVSKECSQAHTVWCRCTSSQGMKICNNLILIRLWLSRTYRSNMSQCLGYDYCSLKKISQLPHGYLGFFTLPLFLPWWHQ